MGDTSAKGALSVEALCWRCQPDQFDFGSTDELADLDEVIGQDRAVEAIKFAIDMDRPSYNLFALGAEGTGKHTVTRQFLEERARRGEPPADWCYISNFKEPRKPRALRLAPGRGAAFRDDMERFAEDLGDALRGAFESDEHRTSSQVIEEEIKDRQERAVAEIEQAAKARGIALFRTPQGFTFAPLSEGKVVTPEVYQGYPEADQKRIEGEIQELQKLLQAALQQVPVWMKETRDKLRALNHETAMFAVGHLVEALHERYADDVSVKIYLDEVRDDVVDNVEAIVAPQQAAAEGPPGPPGARSPAEALARKYRVNLVVDNGALEHAPVVYEDDPTYERLVGRIEHRAEMGTLVTDFHMVQAGALHRANGGYLMLDARKLLSQPMAWQGLKQALRASQIRIEPIGRVMGAISTVSLEPEPIPLDVKVVLIGERMIYYMLSDADPDFRRLFKVAADFDEQIERSDENNALYARLVATLARAEKLKPLDCAGVARALEYSARQAGDSERLSTRLESLADLLREADYWAAKNGNGQIGGDDVQRAVDAQTRRLDRVRERTQEQIARGTVAIDTGGSVVGQVNGLAVLQVGGFAFGRPSRITARVRIGKGEVIDIEREVTLGGPLHSKGVLILSGYLSAHYASDRPLSLSASLVFEQSYGGIDGDSASSTELYALLSAISGVPIKQGFAVTGSVNQFGTVQAIGGANEKIEGFFDICAERGLTGDQGVLIPATNVKNLMLHRRVVDAARDGKFHIYPVETIEQGIEILTGMPAGQRGADGEFPEGSLNRLVEARLVELADKRRDFNRDARADEET